MKFQFGQNSRLASEACSFFNQTGSTENGLEKRNQTEQLTQVSVGNFVH